MLFIGTPWQKYLNASTQKLHKTQESLASSPVGQEQLEIKTAVIG